jgi:hypothetical protein
LKAKNTAIKGEIKKMKGINAELQSKLNDLDQYGRKNDIIVRNIPVEENKNLNVKLTNVANKLGVTLKVFDIVAAHKLPTNKGIDPIIIRFHSFTKKKELIEAVKTKGNGGWNKHHPTDIHG